MKKLIDSNTFIVLAICVFAMVGGSLTAMKLIELANQFIQYLN